MDDRQDDQPFREVVDDIGKELSTGQANYLMVHVDAIGANYRRVFFEGASLVFSMIDHSEELMSDRSSWRVWRIADTVLVIAEINAPSGSSGTRDLKTLVMYMNPRRTKRQSRELLACYVTLTLLCRDGLEYSLERAESLVKIWANTSPVHIVNFRDLRETSRTLVRWVNKEHWTHTAKSTYLEKSFSRDAVKQYKKAIEQNIIDQAESEEQYDTFFGNVFESKIELPLINDEDGAGDEAEAGAGAGAGAAQSLTDRFRHVLHRR